MSASERRLAWLFLCSGAGALCVEVAISRLLADVVGGAAPAAAAVSAAYLGGLALGALSGGQARAGRNPTGALTSFALLELAGAAWAVAVPPMVPLLRLAAAGLGVHGLARALLAALTLMPAAVLGGATLPACAGLLTDRGGEVGRTAGTLYAANAVGAGLGAALSGLVLIPAIGLWGAAGTGAGLQLAGALVALVLSRTAPAEVTPPGAYAAVDPSPAWRSLGAATLAGAAGLAAEVLWIRLLLPWLGGTARALAGLLGLYLLGLGVGSAFSTWVTGRRASATAAVCLAIAGCWLALGGRLGERLLEGWIQAQAPGHGWWLAVLWMAPATLAFGAATPPLLSAHSRGRSPGQAVAAVCAVSGVGSLLGAVGAPFVLAPWLGARGGIWIAGFTAVVAAALLLHPRALLALVACAAPVLFASRALLTAVPQPPGVAIVRRVEGPLAEAWSVDEPVEHARGLTVNGRLREGGTALEARAAEALQAHVPLLWHPAPKRVLWLGVGSGLSLAAASSHPHDELVGVELLPEVLTLLPDFLPFSRGALEASLVADDGRSYLLASPERYDAIVAELFYPWEVGAGGLYSVEQFAAARAHLAPGGLFCQWLPLYLLPPRALSVVAESLRESFPHAAALAGLVVAGQPQIALCGSETPLGEPRNTDERVAALHDGGELQRLWGHPAEALRSLRLFGDEGIAALAAGAPPETDLRPRVEFLSEDVDRRASWSANLSRVAELSEGNGPAATARRELWAAALALGRGDWQEAARRQSAAEADAPWLAESALPGLRLEAVLRRERRYDDAERLLQRATAVLDPDAATLFMAGTLRLRAHDPRAAEPLLQRSIELDGRCSQCFRLLGTALAGEGRNDEAAAAWQRALSLDPEDGLARTFLRQAR